MLWKLICAFNKQALSQKIATQHFGNPPLSPIWHLETFPRIPPPLEVKNVIETGKRRFRDSYHKKHPLQMSHFFRLSFCFSQCKIPIVEALALKMLMLQRILLQSHSKTYLSAKKILNYKKVLIRQRLLLIDSLEQWCPILFFRSPQLWPVILDIYHIITQ